MAGHGIVFQRRLYFRSQAVEAISHIGDTGNQPNFGPGRYQVVNPGTPPFIPAIQEGLMTSIQTHEIMLLTHFNLGGVLLS
ncbi:TPA: hypothetical protein L1N72_004972, partial [Escherichia coli]|nr:hypothetical protein [Escherichia coli]